MSDRFLVRLPAVTDRSATGSAPVEVFLVRLDAGEAEVARAEKWLSPTELGRAHRGTADVRRRRVLLRAGLRLALGRRLGLAPSAVRLRVTPAGRPMVHAGPPGLDANCSASGDVGLVAVSDGLRVGVDVERVAPWDPDVLSEGWLSAQERAAIAALPVADRPVAVTRSWTRKEAVLKGLGIGLPGGPQHLSPKLGPAPEHIAGWVLHDVQAPAGSIASLATSPWPGDGHRAVPEERVRRARHAMERYVDA